MAPQNGARCATAGPPRPLTLFGGLFVLNHFSILNRNKNTHKNLFYLLRAGTLQALCMSVLIYVSVEVRRCRQAAFHDKTGLPGLCRKHKKYGMRNFLHVCVYVWNLSSFLESSHILSPSGRIVDRSGRRCSKMLLPTPPIKSCSECAFAITPYCGYMTGARGCARALTDRSIAAAIVPLSSTYDDCCFFPDGRFVTCVLNHGKAVSKRYLLALLPGITHNSGPNCRVQAKLSRFRAKLGRAQAKLSRFRAKLSRANLWPNSAE